MYLSHARERVRKLERLDKLTPMQGLSVIAIAIALSLIAPIVAAVLFWPGYLIVTEDAAWEWWCAQVVWICMVVSVLLVLSLGIN